MTCLDFLGNAIAIFVIIRDKSFKHVVEGKCIVSSVWTIKSQYKHKKETWSSNQIHNIIPLLKK